MQIKKKFSHFLFFIFFISDLLDNIIMYSKLVTVDIHLKFFFYYLLNAYVKLWVKFN